MREGDEEEDERAISRDRLAARNGHARNGAAAAFVVAVVADAREGSKGRLRGSRLEASWPWWAVLVDEAGRGSENWR